MSTNVSNSVLDFVMNFKS